MTNWNWIKFGAGFFLFFSSNDEIQVTFAGQPAIIAIQRTYNTAISENV